MLSNFEKNVFPTVVGESIRKVPTGLGATQGLLSKLLEAKIDVKMQIFIFRFGTSNHYYQVNPNSNFVFPGSKTATKWRIVTGTAACA